MESGERERRLAAFAAKRAGELGHLRRAAVADLERGGAMLPDAQLSHRRVPTAEVRRRIDLLRRVSGDDQRSAARHAAAQQGQLQRGELLRLVDQHAVEPAWRGRRYACPLRAQALQLEQHRVVLHVDGLRVARRGALVDGPSVHRDQAILVDVRVLALRALRELDAGVVHRFRRRRRRQARAGGQLLHQRAIAEQRVQIVAPRQPGPARRLVSGRR